MFLLYPSCFAQIKAGGDISTFIKCFVKLFCFHKLLHYRPITAEPQQSQCRVSLYVLCFFRIKLKLHDVQYVALLRHKYKEKEQKESVADSYPYAHPMFHQPLGNIKFSHINSNLNTLLLALHTPKFIQSRPRHLRHNRHQSRKKLTVSTSANMESEMVKRRYQRL